MWHVFGINSSRLWAVMNSLREFGRLGQIWSNGPKGKRCDSSTFRPNLVVDVLRLTVTYALPLSWVDTWVDRSLQIPQVQVFKNVVKVE